MYHPPHHLPATYLPDSRKPTAGLAHTPHEAPLPTNGEAYSSKWRDWAKMWSKTAITATCRKRICTKRTRCTGGSGVGCSAHDRLIGMVWGSEPWQLKDVRERRGVKEQNAALSESLKMKIDHEIHHSSASSSSLSSSGWTSMTRSPADFNTRLLHARTPLYIAYILSATQVCKA